MKPARIAALALFAALSTSCNITDPEPDASWIEHEVKAPSDRVLWKLALLSVGDSNYPLTGGLDPSEGEITTGWKMNLQPVSRKGYRSRAMLEMDPIEPGVWNIKARVQKQYNHSMVAPLDPQRADWKWGPDDEIGAAIIVQRISALLDPEFELTPVEKDPFEKLMEHVESIESEHD